MQHKECPRCGGRDRFFLIATPHTGGPPFWLCRQCRHTQRAGDDDAAISRRPPLTREEIAQVQAGYAAVAAWCASYLWTPGGRAALDWLRDRGLSDATIYEAGLGYHPQTVGYAKTGDLAADFGVGGVLFRANPTAYAGAALGGLLGPQGRPKFLLRDAITIPYWHRGACTLVRTRKLAPPDPAKKYLNPGGAFFAGGTPTLYGADVLDDPSVTEVVLTEGELKALASRQAGVPAVAQPGIAYLPPAYIEALKHKTVIVGYDTEARADPFTLSPGEQFTLATVERLTGIALKRTIDESQSTAEQLKAKNKAAGSDDVDLQREITIALGAIDAQLARAKAALNQLQAQRIHVKVLRLPRPADVRKVDLDSYILAAGPEAYAQRIRHTPRGEDWHARHAGGGYSYEKGHIVNGKPIANYQARIIETIYESDGVSITAKQRLALRTPGGKLATADIPDTDWADDRAARQALRVALREGTFDDDPREVLRAIRLLSNHGDPPGERAVYVATGWEQIAGRWHFLASDGSISADGPTQTVRAEVDPEAPGNHYALCGPGDPAAGAAAWLQFLRGAVCPQPLALIMAAQAALPLIHRFSGDVGRTMVWLFQQSGALKTAMTRAAVMALYGPGFTAVAADAGRVPKWDATPTSLGLLTFTFRDMPVLIDDYKPGMISVEHFRRFLHNYSEGGGRGRATRELKLDKVRGARAIVFATAEDVPSVGDYGMEARLLAMQMPINGVDPQALATLQRAGVDGHLAAFWRGFVQTIAHELDAGEGLLRQRIQQLLAADDAALPGHKRAQNALRQNRMAWLVLSRWMRRAGCLDDASLAALDEAHLAGRQLLAQVLTERQRDSKPSTIFLGVLRELLTSGEVLIEHPGMACPKCGSALIFTDQAWYCTGKLGEHQVSCPYSIAAEKVVGFSTRDGEVGLFAERAFRKVSQVRRDQNQPFAFSSTAIWQQLDAEGLLLSKGKDGRYQSQQRNPARLDKAGYPAPAKVLHVKRSAMEEPADDEEPAAPPPLPAPSPARRPTPAATPPPAPAPPRLRLTVGQLLDLDRAYRAGDTAALDALADAAGATPDEVEQLAAHRAARRPT